MNELQRKEQREADLYGAIDAAVLAGFTIQEVRKIVEAAIERTTRRMIASGEFMG